MYTAYIFELMAYSNFIRIIIRKNLVDLSLLYMKMHKRRSIYSILYNIN